MIRHCDGTDPNLRTFPENETGNCGATFDDVDHSVLCPHPKIAKPHPLGDRAAEIRAEILNTVYPGRNKE